MDTIPYPPAQSFDFTKESNYLLSRCVFTIHAGQAQCKVGNRGYRQVNRWLQGISCHWPMAGSHTLNTILWPPHRNYHTVATTKNTNTDQNTPTPWLSNSPTQPWTHSRTLLKHCKLHLILILRLCQLEWYHTTLDTVSKHTTQHECSQLKARKQ